MSTFHTSKTASPKRKRQKATCACHKCAGPDEDLLPMNSANKTAKHPPAYTWPRSETSSDSEIDLIPTVVISPSDVEGDDPPIRMRDALSPEPSSCNESTDSTNVPVSRKRKSHAQRKVKRRKMSRKLEMVNTTTSSDSDTDQDDGRFQNFAPLSTRADNSHREEKQSFVLRQESPPYFRQARTTPMTRKRPFTASSH